MLLSGATERDRESRAGERRLKRLVFIRFSVVDRT